MYLFQEIFPQNKRSLETFSTFFRERGLGPIADMQTAQLATRAKKEAQKNLAEMIKNEESVPEVRKCIDFIRIKILYIEVLLVCRLSSNH